MARADYGFETVFPALPSAAFRRAQYFRMPSLMACLPFLENAR